MSNFQQQHPEEDLLLRYLDGELNSRQSRRVKKHLEACWQCRTELESLQNTVADCIRYRKNVLGAYLPSPPAPWADLYRGFAEIDAAAAGESRTARWFVSFRMPAAAMAAVLLVVVGLYYHFHETPSVEAAALLKRAVAVESTRPRTPQRLAIRTRHSQITRVTGARAKAERQASAAPAVEAMFLAAHYDWDDPLSAKSYQGWHDGLASKKDEVTTGANEYRIRTHAGGSELVTASLTLRITDLHPVEGRFEFNNQEWVEVKEITEAATRADGFAVETEVGSPLRRVVPSQPAASPSGSSASISEELQVLAALHEIGADLGDPVEVTRAGGRLMVSGVGVLPRRQQDIHRALNGIPNVSIRFAEPSSAEMPEEPPAAAAAPPAGKSTGFQARVEQQLGGRAEFEKFSGQLLDFNEAAMARAYALRALAQRFPAGDDAAFSAQDRRVLMDLALSHATVLAKDAGILQRTLAPVLTSLGGSPAQGRPVSTPAAWQPAAEDLFRASRRVEVLLSVMLGVTPGENPTERLPSDLLSAMNDLRASLEVCQKLLAQ